MFSFKSNVLAIFSMFKNDRAAERHNSIISIQSVKRNGQNTDWHSVLLQSHDWDADVAATVTFLQTAQFTTSLSLTECLHRFQPSTARLAFSHTFHLNLDSNKFYCPVLMGSPSSCPHIDVCISIYLVKSAHTQTFYRSTYVSYLVKNWGFCWINALLPLFPCWWKLVHLA